MKKYIHYTSSIIHAYMADRVLVNAIYYDELLTAVITYVTNSVLYVISEKKTRKPQGFKMAIKGRKFISVMLLQMERWSARLTHFSLLPPISKFLPVPLPLTLSLPLSLPLPLPLSYPYHEQFTSQQLPTSLQL